MQSAKLATSELNIRMAAPKVSIIINCLNGELFLEEALDSAISQTFEDWELILFDDRSSDRSAEIFHGYADSRFNYVMAEVRLDLTAAREEALKHARGEWVAFLDQDDVWHSDKLERQLGLLDTSNHGEVGFIYGRAKRIGYIDEGKDFDHHFEGRLLPENNIFDSLSTVANFIPMSSVMLRRSAYEAMEPVPKNIRLCPDYFYWMSISRQWQVRALQETCCLYRVRGSDFNSPNGVQIFTEFLNVIEYFSDEIDHQVMEKRRRSCQNLIAIAEIASGLRWKGITRVLRHGSLIHLFQHAPIHLFRMIRNGLLYQK